jgi:hypothetical protein
MSENIVSHSPGFDQNSLKTSSSDTHRRVSARGASEVDPLELTGGLKLSGQRDFFAHSLHLRQQAENSAIASEYQVKKSEALKNWVAESLLRAEKNQVARSQQLTEILDRKFPSFSPDGGEGFGKVSPLIGKSCELELPAKPAICGFDYFAATGYVCNEFETVTVSNVSVEVGRPNLVATLDYLRNLVKTYWPISVEFEDVYSKAPTGYKFSESWFGGRIKIAWHPERPDQRVYFVCTGSLMEQLDYANQYDLILGMVGIFGFRPTRIDPYIRDFDYKILPKEISAWHDAGYLCRFKSDSAGFYKTGACGKKGQTFTAGGRGKSGGGIFLRVYDEAQEPRSPAPAIKYECEYSGVKAQNLVKLLLSQPFSEDSLFQLCQQLVIGPGVIDFRSGEKTKTLASRRRVRKWAKFVDGVKLLRIPGKVKKPKIDGFPLVSFCHQWGKKLAEVATRDPLYVIESLKILSGDLAPIIYAALDSGQRRLEVLKNDDLATNSC